MALRGDYAAGYRAARRILALGEARGYEPGTSQARAFFALFSCWAEPIENSVHAAQRAREGLIAGGDLANAGYTYYASVPGMLDCAPSLDRYLTEAEAAVAFVRRTGSEQSDQCARHLPVAGRCTAWRQHGRSGRGGFRRQVRRQPAGASLRASSTMRSPPPIFGDQAGLVRHTEAAMRLLPVALGLYPTAVARLLRGLALAGQARAADGGERGALLAELDEVTRWLAARAADAPDNFLHLLRLVEAERAWAAGDFRAAGLAYRRRPARGRPAPAAVAPGPDHRTRGPVLPRPRSGACRLRASRPGPPAVPRLGRDR